MTERGSVRRSRFDHAKSRLISIDIAPIFLGASVEPWFGLDGEPTEHAGAEAESDEWLARCAELEACNPTVQAAWNRAAIGSLVAAISARRRRRKVHAHGGHSEIYGPVRSRRSDRRHPFGFAQPVDPAGCSALRRQMDRDSRR